VLAALAPEMWDASTLCEGWRVREVVAHMTMAFRYSVPKFLLGMLAAGGISFYLLSNAMKTLPAGTAYAVWTGIGAAGTAVVGILLLGESSSPLRVASLALIVAGVIGLRLA